MTRGLLVGFLFVGIGCIAPEPEENSSEGVNKGGFTSQALQLILAPQISKGTPPLIHWETSRGAFRWLSASEGQATFFEEAGDLGPGLMEATRDFFTKNKEKEAFSPKGGLSFGHHVLRAEGLHALSQTWLDRPEEESMSLEGYRGKYPSAPIVSVSVPGHSVDGTIGVLFVQRYWGPSAGDGRFYVFHMREGLWVESEIMLAGGWIS